MPQVAQDLQSQGRGEDSMLVHMTPGEVGGLQALAQQIGGSLTVNPNTGLPEAGILGKLLPVLAGLGLNFFLPGVGSAIGGALGGLGSAAGTGILVGGATTAITGNLGKGLMAGLGAFGGASLGSALAPGATSGIATGAAPATTGGLEVAVPEGLKSSLPLGIPQGSPLLANVTAPAIAPANIFSTAGSGMALSGAGDIVARTALPSALASGAGAGAGAAPGLLGRFGQAASAGLGGAAAKAAPFAAGMGLLNPFISAPKPMDREAPVDNSYQGPYYMQERKATFAPSTEDLLSSTKEREYFSAMMPEVYNAAGQLISPGTTTAPGTPILQSVLNPNAKKGEPMYSFQTIPWMMSPEEQRKQQLEAMGLSLPVMAKGGEIHLKDGAFVVDARTVSELGNGSSGAGQEVLARMGGRPVRGPGDGVSDSVPARIGRDQPARVARDEVIFSPEAVQRVGKGSHKKGAQKLYDMMEKAHKARKKAGRGSNTKLASGLGALA